ncbi:hypothetical protein PG985_004813 [Apiospora marii]|uniref:uncharacterized protein n=1 Tax=Apiospora marii TaxID=335849 RepID=UPI0031312EDC
MRYIKGDLPTHLHETQFRTALEMAGQLPTPSMAGRAHYQYLASDALVHPNNVQPFHHWLASPYNNLSSPFTPSSPAPNCSVWIGNIPLDCTVGELLQHVRECDKIFTIDMKPPRILGRQAAAQLVFWSPLGPIRLLKQPPIAIRGQRLYIRSDKIYWGPRSPGPQSRVLLIQGPASIINPEVLSYIFKEVKEFQIDEVIDKRYANGLGRSEWRFGSSHQQAEKALQILLEKKNKEWDNPKMKQDWQQVEVYYGEDPCAPTRFQRDSGHIMQLGLF